MLPATRLIFWLVACCCCCRLISVSATPNEIRFKRQALADRLGDAASGALTGFSGNNKPLRTPTISGKFKQSSQANGSLGGNPQTNQQPPTGNLNPNLDDVNIDAPEVDSPTLSANGNPTSSVDSSSSTGTSDEDFEPPRRKPTRLRPQAPKRPEASSFAISGSANSNKNKHDDYYNGDDYGNYDDRHHSSSYNDDDQGDDYYQAGSGFMRMANGPMRHMKGMIASLFDNMEDEMADGDYAAASTYSNGGGYARSRSVVNNNGRLRGVMSETRNGRTRTRRIGPKNGSNEDEYE